ncbi:MAG: DUF58 domain-containing protein [Spirochaetales bacterium]|nr:DUF58 domain-containing protein [Spirochaetales bacterium]
MESAAFFNKVRKIEIIASRLVESLMSGNYRSIFKGQGIEFDEVREYVYGDDVRLIDWNVTSRIGSPYTKTFREERELTLFLIVDLSASIFAGSGAKSKREIESLVFAILGLSAILNNDRVGGIFFSDRIEHWVPPSKGKKHVLRLINDLIRLAPQGKGSDLALALRTVGETLKRKGICIIVSDFKTSDYLDELSLCARKHDCIAVKVYDPADFRFPDTGTWELEDPENGRKMLAGGVMRSFKERYKTFNETRHCQWLENLGRRGVETLEISTSDDPGMKLYQFFQKRRMKTGS